jgi:hypothetical protein
MHTLSIYRGCPIGLKRIIGIIYSKNTGADITIGCMKNKHNPDARSATADQINLSVSVVARSSSGETYL